MATAGPKEPATGTGDSSASVHRTEQDRGALAERAEQADRELRSAKAELDVRNDYVAALESELEETLAFLRVKTAYIESLPWVRLRVWLKGLRSRSK